MRHRLYQVLFLSIAVFFTADFALAAPPGDQTYPASISSYLQNKYPAAENITVQKQNHFGREVYEVRFGEKIPDENGQNVNQQFVLLFRLDGDFYTSAYVVEPNAYNVVSDAVNDQLKSRYPGYKIKAMRMIDNPNGVGNEYEVSIQVSGKALQTTLNDKGEVINEVAK